MAANLHIGGSAVQLTKSQNWTDFSNLSLNQGFAIQLDSVCEIQTHGN